MKLWHERLGREEEKTEDNCREMDDGGGKREQTRQEKVRKRKEMRGAETRGKEMSQGEMRGGQQRDEAGGRWREGQKELRRKGGIQM